jgi:hypothetical protein
MLVGGGFGVGGVTDRLARRTPRGRDSSTAKKKKRKREQRDSR